MSLPTCPPAIATQAPGWDCGAHGWDAHAHVFGPASRFPYATARRYTPPDQTVDDYLRNLDTLGLRHGVLVQPSVYGTDNSALLDALQRARGRLRGVIDLDPATATDKELSTWSNAGVCGVRVWWDGQKPFDALSGLAHRLRGTGWHLDVYCTDTDALHGLARRIDALDMPVIIEAMGTPRGDAPLSTPGLQSLLALLREGAAWAKLSHAYKIDGRGLPYAQALPFARALAEAGPSQLVWGSDWPHPMAAGPIPNDGALLDLLPEWAGSAALARQILSSNPARFYTSAKPPADPPSINQGHHP